MEKMNDMIDPNFIIGIILKRRWLLILPFCIAMIVGIVLVIVLPRIYSASTMILVQPQKVPDQFVQSIVSTDVGSRIDTISQQIMSRTNLERIIARFELFSGPENKNTFMEDKVNAIKQNISVRVIKRGPRAAFSISFKSADPELAMNITNSLASYFIDENLRVREEQVMGTSGFLVDELESIREELESYEEELKAYREKYMGGLPEQLDTNLSILEGLQNQLNVNNENLRYLKNDLILIEKQIEVAKKAEAYSNDIIIADGTVIRSEDLIKLEHLQSNLEDLMIKYTDRHPDIVKIKTQVEELERKIEEKTKSQSDNMNSDTIGNETPGQYSEELVAKLVERTELKIQIKDSMEKAAKIEAKIFHYQQLVENTPKREQELVILRRDYGNIKASYNSLLSRKLESDIAVNMEKKQKGEQFRILDAASLPQKPSEPNMKALFILVVGAGIGLGGGLIFLLEYMNSSFRKPEEIDALLELPVLCTIPRLYQPRELKLQKLNTIFSIFSVMVSLVLFAGFAALTFKGVDKVLDVVTQYVNI